MSSIHSHGKQFMVQYKDAYGNLQNEIVIAEDIDSALDTWLENVVGYECRLQQVWQVK